MTQKFKDNGRALLNGSILAADTSLTVEAAKADRFPVGNTSNWGSPADWFKVVLIDSSGNREVVYVGTRTSGSGVMGNLQRGQEGTTALDFTAGSIVILAITAVDIENALAGIFTTMSLNTLTVSGASTFGGHVKVHSAADPKLEVSKTGTAHAMWHFTAGKLTLAQSDGTGGVTADRFTFDQTNGVFTCADVTITSDERLKINWRNMAPGFLERLARVRAGAYTSKASGEDHVGVSAQSLQFVMPAAVREDEDGFLSVAYGNAALVACVELAREVLALRERVATLEQGRAG